MKTRTLFRFQFPNILCAILCLFVLTETMSLAADYDVVISNGRGHGPGDDVRCGIQCWHQRR
jgi:hypothetical protein